MRKSLPIMCLTMLLFLGGVALVPRAASQVSPASGDPQDKAPLKTVQIKPRILDADFIEFSPDGKNYVTAIGNGPPALYETATGKETRRFKVPFWPSGGRFSPDGRKLALTRSGYNQPTICIVDLESGMTMPSLENCPWTRVPLVEFLPKSKLVAGFFGCDDPLLGVDSRFCFWDMASGKELTEKRKEAPSCVGFAFSENGNHLFVEFATTNDNQKAVGIPQPGFGTKYNVWSELWEANTLKKIADGPSFPHSDPHSGVCLKLLGIHRNAGFRVRLSPGGTALVFPRAQTEVLSIRSDSLSVVDNASGENLFRLEDFKSGVLRAAALSDNGMTLAAVGSKTREEKKCKVFIWAIREFTDRDRFQRLHDSKNQREDLWNALGENDLSLANRAFSRLFATPERTCAFLKQKLKPVPRWDREVLDRLIAELNYEKFATREKAQAALEALGPVILPFLAKSQTDVRFSSEQKRRLQHITEKLKLKEVTSDVLQAIRAIDLLEQIGQPESRKLLQLLAEGEPDAWISGEAKIALERSKSGAL